MGKKGFTLVELLTVIAIIAILAAIIFPVAGTVRENARRSRCTSNLSQIYIALETYKQDYNAYPPVLGAYAYNNQNGTLITGNCQVNPNLVMPFERAPKPLGNYLKNHEVFHCPNNPVDDRQVITAAYYPQGHALAGNLVRLDPINPDSPVVCFYRYDSYTIGRNPANNTYELHYTLFWSNQALNQEENARERRSASDAYGAGYYDSPIGPKQTDTPRQLGYRRPDPTTVVTWCTYHRSYSGGQPVRAKNDLVLFLNNSVKPMDSAEMARFPYNMRP